MRGRSDNNLSTALECLQADGWAYWLGKFVQEVVNKEEKCPARIYGLIIAIKRLISAKKYSV